MALILILRILLGRGSMGSSCGLMAMAGPAALLLLMLGHPLIIHLVIFSLHMLAGGLGLMANLLVWMLS